MNIAMLLEMAAEGMGDRVEVGPRASGLTDTQLLDRSRRVATLVRDAGVERLGFVAPNSNDLPALLFGSAVAGVPFAPLNYRLADDRLQSICARIAPAVLVADPGAVARVSGIDGITVMTNEELADRLAALAPADESQTDPDQVAIWLFTSGTTGEPKAALLRHRHLVSYVLSTVDYMAADEDEATLVSVPPYHIAAMATILSSVYSGRRIMYLPNSNPRSGCRSPTGRASPTPWWYRPCSTVFWMPQRNQDPACRRCTIFRTEAAGCLCPSSSGP